MLPLMSVGAIVAGVLGLSGSMHGPAWVSMVLGGLAVGVYLAVLSLCYVLGKTPLWTVPGFPIGSWLVGGIMRDAARDLERGLPTVWGGREYQRSSR